MIETIVRCEHCQVEAVVRGPSAFPTGPRGWTVDRSTFYQPHGRHRCPKHANQPQWWNSST